MKKLLLLLLTMTIYADDLDLGDDFSTGETVTAEKFNSKFGMIEKVIGMPKDADLIGTWQCRSVYFRQENPFTQYSGGFVYYLDGQITFSESDSSSSLTSPKSWSGNFAEMLFDSNDTSGTYSLFANLIAFRIGSETTNSGAVFEVNLTSEDQLLLKRLKEGGGSLPVVASLCNKSS